MRSRRVVDILRRYRKSAGRSAVPTGALRAVAGEPLVKGQGPVNTLNAGNACSARPPGACSPRRNLCQARRHTAKDSAAGMCRALGPPMLARGPGAEREPRRRA